MHPGIKNVVLLAAGRGTRMQVGEDGHKSLLTLAGRPAIVRIVDAVLRAGVRQVVVVLGHSADRVRSALEAAYGDRLTFVLNERYAEDTNILSTHLGVEALDAPQDGYLIVETDVALEDAAWTRILSAPGDRSFWVTGGAYGPDLTGGALHVGSDGRVDRLVYAPVHDPAFDGFGKLVGILYVAPAQSAADRRLRAAAIDETIAQYYMTPWVRSLDQLECGALDMGPMLAVAYNDAEAYQRADDLFAEVSSRGLNA